MAAPPSDPTAVDDPSDVAANDVDAPVSSARLVAEAKDSAPPPSGALFGDARDAMLAFLASRQQKEGRDYLQRVIVKKLGNGIEPELMGELVQAAFNDCVAAKKPPRFVWGVRSWVARVTRRAIAHWFEAKKDDDENLDPEADAVDWSDRHAPKTDYAARAHLINKWLAARIGDDPRKVETFRLMTAHEVDGHSLKELAAANGTTARALANRFHKLRKELAPQVELMDREKPRQAILLLLFLFGAGVVGLVVYLLVHLLTPQWAQAPVHGRQHAPRVVVAPPSTFDNALPTQPPSPAPPQPQPEDHGKEGKTQ